MKDSYSEAMEWLNTSITAKETYPNLAIKARLLNEQGKKAEAIAAGEKAISVGRASTPPANPNAINGLQVLVNEWKAIR